MSPIANKQNIDSAFRFTEDSIEVSTLPNVASTSTPRLKKHSSQNLPKASFHNHSFDNDSLLSDGHATHDASSAGSAKIQRKLNLKWYMRLFLLLAAILIGFFVAGVVYYFARKVEVEEFENGFAELSRQVQLSLEERLRRKLLALDSLSVALTSATLASEGLNWPTTSLPGFQDIASNILSACESQSILFAPQVQNGTLSVWNEYLAAAFAQGSTSVFKGDKGVTASTYSTSLSFLVELHNSFRVWQHYPYSSELLNFDLLSNPSSSLLAFLSSHQVVFGNARYISKETATDELEAYYSSLETENVFSRTQSLMSNVYYPIFDSFDVSARSLVGLLSMDVFWAELFTALVPLGSEDEVVCVLRNECGQVYTYTVQSNEVIGMEEGDTHQNKYDHMESTFDFDALKVLEAEFLHAELDDFCRYELYIYPSLSLEENYITFKPALYTASATFCLVVIFIMSMAYERRVAHVNESAVQYRAVVTNLFPPAVRRRMFRKDDKKKKRGAAAVTKSASFEVGPKECTLVPANNKATKGANNIMEVEDLTLLSKPIADHFKNVTVMFADIAGFTSWSSKRSPEQVFRLLQTLFNTFDSIAKKRRVFKVETIGDCYMACTGLPEVQEDHALRMTKFARECLYRVKPLLVRLEETLGPGTVDLAIRVGIHSGPVTAGVLQGEKSRFQLFGDTVNTASRMESNGEPGRIHLSQSTAALLIKADKEHWLQKRKDPIHAKGKGLMETFWIQQRTRRSDPVPSGRGQPSPDNSDSEGFSDPEFLAQSFTSLTSRLSETSRVSESSRMTDMSGQINSCFPKDTLALYDLPSYSTGKSETVLIEWHVSILGVYLKRILHNRSQLGGVSRSPVQTRGKGIVSGSCPFDEISETISLPVAPQKLVRMRTVPPAMEIPTQVIDELRDYVTTIAQSYRQNQFHNFARATHTAMFMNKFLQEISKRATSSQEAECLQIIASDPLIQFSLMFAALIHDADHSGVPNEVLAIEQRDFAKVYKGRLLAEQHALDLSWELLMDKGFKTLQQCICSTRAELLRFRQILVNLVLATDTMDKEMYGIRSLRWDEAFSPAVDIVPGRERIRLKVAVVIELLLQVADVSHATQAWSIFARWSKKQYLEANDAYVAGRSQSDPAKAWYAREAFMFDRQAIPLIEKLVQITGWETLLENVKSNRQEWIVAGKKLVKDFAAEASFMNQGSDNSFNAFGEGSYNSSYRFKLEGDGDPHH